MKKFILGTFVVLASLASAQSYQDYYPAGNGNPYGNDDYYTDEDDRYYFPDDYYYEYPSDYYADDFYRDSYNDYRRSIDAVNWNRFFVQYRLAPWQIEQILYLNSMYASFGMWNDYYRYNPDRWYYDRFYALERILGSRIFVVFQNNYYNGYSPVVYWRNYRIRHYAPAVFVMPRYRNVNINIYHVDRNRYHQNNGYFYSPRRQDFGFKNSPRSGANGNWNNGRNEGFRSSTVERNNTGRNNTPGFRNEGMRSSSNNDGRMREMNKQDSGFRNENQGMRSNPSPKVVEPQTQKRESSQNEGFRNSSGQERTRKQSVSPSQRSSSSESRNSGQRFVNRS